jgi:predicted secreted protein
MSTTVLMGNFLGLYLDGKLAGYEQNASLSISKQTTPTNHKGSGGWSDSEATIKSFSGSGDGFVASDGGNFDALFDLIDSDDKIDFMMCEQIEEEDGEGNITLKPKPNGKRWSGKAHLKELSMNANLNETTQYNISIEGAGKIKKGTNPAA